MLQSASLEPAVGAFTSGVIHCTLEVFSAIEHLVKENAQVMSELKLKEKKNPSTSNPSYLLTKASRD